MRYTISTLNSVATLAILHIIKLLTVGYHSRLGRGGRYDPITRFCSRRCLSCRRRRCRRLISDGLDACIRISPEPIARRAS
jgi:hypothetical protein